jgi:tRNA(Met) C34 N-acetyltransferase TmcA
MLPGRQRALGLGVVMQTFSPSFSPSTQEEEAAEFKASLVHRVSSRIARATQRNPVLKKKRKERKGKERKRKERKGKERKGKERKGKERKGKERKGKEREKTFVIFVSLDICLGDTASFFFFC